MPFYRFIDSDVESDLGSDLQLDRPQRQSGKRSPPPQPVQEPVIIDLESDESDAGGEGGDSVHGGTREGDIAHLEHRGDQDVTAEDSGGQRDVVHKQASQSEIQQHTGDLVDSGIFIPELVQEQEKGIDLAHDNLTNARVAERVVAMEDEDSLLANEEILDIDHPHEGDILSSFMMNGVRQHKSSPLQDNRRKRQQSPNHNTPDRAHPVTVTSKDIDKILARPRKAPELMVPQHRLQISRDIPYGDLVISDVSSGGAVSKIAHSQHQSRTTPATTRTPSAPRSPQTPLPYDCQQCRMYDRPCNGMIPCFSCVTHGQGKKCVYRGGRGGGSSGAKALSKLSAQTPQPALTRSMSALPRPGELSGTKASQSVPARGGWRQFGTAKPPSMTAPSTPTITKVQMKNRDPADARQVRCEGCISIHRPCDGMLPCQRCENRVRKGVRPCCYSEKRFVRATLTTEAEAAEPNFGRAVAERAVVRLPSSPSAPVSIPPARRRSAPVTEEEVPDSDSDDQHNRDIPFKDEDDLDEETMDVVPTTNEPAPVAPSEEDHRRPSTATTAKKRRFSEVSQDDDDEGPPLEPRQFNQRRSYTNLEAVDPTWTPEGANINRRVTNRPTTRLSASTGQRRSQVTTRAGGNANAFAISNANSDQKTDDKFRTIKPEHVPDMVKEMLASAREDIVLDIAPPGSDPLESLSPPRTKTASRMNNLEAMLVQREKLDAAALRRELEAIQQDPSSGWARMTEQEREHMAAQRRRQLMEQRDSEGLSASYFAGQLLDLATSCVGPVAMLGYLMQSRRAKLKVVGLLDGLVQYDWNDGKLKVPASYNKGRG